MAGATKIPADHAGRTNDVCLVCHKRALGPQPTVAPTTAATAAPAAGTTGTGPTFQKDILPIIQQKCAGCHGGTAGLTLTDLPSLLKGGTSGPAIKPGDPDGSLMIQKQTQTHTDTTRKLSDAQLNTIKAWIKAGAPSGTAGASPTATPVKPGEAPKIPHSLTGRENCTSCHQTGANGAPKFPANHEGRTNELCKFCHEMVAVTAAKPAGEGPPHIPHELQGRDNCLACHKDGVGGATKIPASHAGRTNDICKSCHPPAASAPGAETGPRAPVIVPPIPTPIQYPFSPGQHTCVNCHKTLAGKHKEITAAWESSIHATRGVRCPDCHGGDPSATSASAAMSPAAGYIGVPDKQKIPGLCASCHARPELMRQYDIPVDQYAKYLESQHGQLLAQGDLRVATCFDCHDGHGTKQKKDVAAKVYPTNSPALCASCHSDKNLMAPYGIPTNQFELYEKSVHGIALLQKQDMRAPNCATCHGTHGAVPPGFKEVANVCGSCHTATQEAYLKSKHAVGDGPKCVTCHGRYDVTKPTEDLFVGNQPRHCGSCHPANSPIGEQVDQIHRVLTEASTAYEEGEAKVKEAEQRGLIVTVEEGRLRESNTNLITARAVQHTTQLATIEEKTKKSTEISAGVKKAAENAIQETVFRRQAMVVSVAAVLFTVVGLIIAKREMDRAYVERWRRDQRR
ncbi:MAG: hypothetical protein A2Z04_01820 [Chloroflexi bacterium RBG_16_57_9]|nr:MAG: hypothetical protein A2Z04_01820 [Chloroflexi bacterium RBG_16_57_9]